MLPKVVMVLYPHFSPFHLTVPQMVFSTKVDDKALFEWQTAAVSTDWVLGEGGFAVRPDGDLALLAAADIIVIAGWHDISQPPEPALISALQSAYRRGATLVGLCFGAYALAYAGLLDAKSASTHWSAEQDFCQRFPCVKLDKNALYVEDDRLITSAGTVAGLDCCLAIVRQFHGVKIANKLARLLVVAPHRSGGQAQFIEQPLPRKTTNQSINELLDYLRQNLAAAHTIDALAERLSMSRSTFTRHFRKATGTSVNQWLIDTRMQRGRDLLESTTLSIEQIAAQIGLQASAFRHYFKVQHQITPQQWRKVFHA